MQSFGGSNRHRKQLESDRYCWTCHRGEPELPCATCVRSFHVSPSCSQAKSLSEEEMLTWRCPDCIDTERGIDRIKAEYIDASRLKETLQYNIKRIIDDKKGFAKPFMNIEYYTKGKVVNTMDLNTIKKKIEIGAYSCCEEFWSDVMWIVHNTKCHCSDEYDTMKAAKQLHNCVKEEVYNLQICYDCYTNINDDWMVTPCTKPHILVWAKQRTYPYWPAKLMRYNSDQNTVDVRYFGDENLRAVIPAKDCLLYSQRSPSSSIGSHRNSLNDAIEETELYIKNLKKKYGSFHYADSITAFHGNSMERHLYDMIPNAWKELGRPDVPPPISKSMPASATSFRRMSLPVQRKKRTFAPPPPPVFTKDFTVGRIMTRRMSAALEGTLEGSSVEQQTNEIKKETAIKATVYRRQSVQIERLSSCVSTLIPSSEATKAKAFKTTQIAAKKRKMHELEQKLEKLDLEIRPSKCTKIANDSNQATSISKSPINPADDSVFKIPAIPTRRKSTGLPRKPSECSSSVSNDRDFNDKAQLPTQSKSGQKTKTPSKEVSTIEYTPNMMDICNAVMEKSTQKVAESVRLSLSDALTNHFEPAKTNDQYLLEQLEKQRNNYEQLVQGLRGQNRDLKASLKKFKEKCALLQNKKSVKEADDVSEQNAKFETVVADLKKAEAKIIELSARLNAVSTKSAYMTTTIAKLQETNIGLANSLKSAETKNVHLTNVNKNLMDGHIKLNTSMDNALLENKILTHRLKELQAKSEAVKNQTYEHYARMITDIKKKQWCATCGMPGGRYFCSPQCETYHWKQERRHSVDRRMSMQ